MTTMDRFLGELQAPVLVISSKAGLGNHRAGAELARQIGAAHAVKHVPIELLISEKRVRLEFDRHRWICLNAPWLLHLVNGLPFSYKLKLLRESFVESSDARFLAERVASFGARTILAVNNRAAFWLGSLRRRGKLGAVLWAFLTDYAISMGWRFQFWPEVDRVFGPVPRDEVPPDARDRYHQVEMPVREGFRKIAAVPGGVDQVLLCGGGWGLGRLAEVSKELARSLPWVKQHVVCGDNQRLFMKMKALQIQSSNTRVYPHVKDLEAILQKCASIITKPGGLTLAEAHAARRTIFLIDALPGVEEKNRAYALKHLDARVYSLISFGDWVSRRRADGGLWEDG